MIGDEGLWWLDKVKNVNQRGQDEIQCSGQFTLGHSDS